MTFHDWMGATPGGNGAARPGGNLDDLRRQNLSAVLRAVHINNGCTRAEITHKTGLNRSTVRALVNELVQAGIVVQQDPESSGVVGRPSPSVHASGSVRVLAVNPEVDATVGAIVGLGGEVLARATVPHASSPTPTEVVEAVRVLREQLAPEGGVRGIGVAVPGLVDRRTNRVSVAPHLGWWDVALTEMLEVSQGLPVVVENDANCGLMAEALFGAGRGYSDLVYLNGGASGIGGAAITGGILLAGADGYASEFGHTLVTTPGRACDCGASGCLETEVTREKLLDSLGNVEPSVLDSALLAARESGAGAKHPAMVEADRQLQFLGVALRTVVNVMNPERVLLGGFLASLVEARGVGELGVELAHTLRGARSGLDVVAAELGADILAVGAAELMFRAVIADPLAPQRDVLASG